MEKIDIWKTFGIQYNYCVPKPRKNSRKDFSVGYYPNEVKLEYDMVYIAYYLRGEWLLNDSWLPSGMELGASSTTFVKNSPYNCSMAKLLLDLWEENNLLKDRIYDLESWRSS